MDVNFSCVFFVLRRQRGEQRKRLRWCEGYFLVSSGLLYLRALLPIYLSSKKMEMSSRIFAHMHLHIFEWAHASGHDNPTDASRTEILQLRANACPWVLVSTCVKAANQAAKWLMQDIIMIDSLL